MNFGVHFLTFFAVKIYPSLRPPLWSKINIIVTKISNKRNSEKNYLTKGLNNFSFKCEVLQNSYHSKTTKHPIIVYIDGGMERRYRIIVVRSTSPTTQSRRNIV